MEHSLPAVQALYLSELVRRWNVSTSELLATTGVRPETLEDPGARIDIPTAVKLIERARALTGEPALGYYLGLQMRLSMHGYLGFAAWSAPTMRAAADLMVQFTPIVTTAVGLRLRVEGRDASIIVDEHADFGTARDVVLLAVLVGIWQMAQTGTGRELRGGSLDVALPSPPYAPALQIVEPAIRFDQPLTRLAFDAARLDFEYKMADPVALRLAKEHCERELNALGLDGRVGGRVRSLVARSKAGFPSLHEVAMSLATSPRTLKRQLAAEGCTFTEILEGERREAAMVLLRTPDLTIEQIATRLGYSNVPNFTRAFRRWTGATPADFRNGASAKIGAGVEK
jgi:AraC-like DNA-binding protein